MRLDGSTQACLRKSTHPGASTDVMAAGHPIADHEAWNGQHRHHLKALSTAAIGTNMCSACATLCKKSAPLQVGTLRMAQYAMSAFCAKSKEAALVQRINSYSVRLCAGEAPILPCRNVSPSSLTTLAMLTRSWMHGSVSNVCVERGHAMTCEKVSQGHTLHHEYCGISLCHGATPSHLRSPQSTNMVVKAPLLSCDVQM